MTESLADKSSREANQTTDDDLGQLGPFQPMDTAPRDGTLVIGREEDGACHLMRWRSKARMLEEDGAEDQGTAPYWARWRTDTGLKPVEWAPTELTPETALDRV